MVDAAKLLAALPPVLRDALLEEYRGIATSFSEERWRAAGIDAGRFCEVVFTVLDGALRGSYPSVPSKPPNFVAACRGLETRPSVPVGDRSLRIMIPRVLVGIYDIRNNRNVGHVGGDVVANKMDATYVRDAATWVLAELTRVMHGVSTHEAQVAVDALVERVHPLVWEHEGIRRVLNPKLSAPDQTLILLYSEADWCSEVDLRLWTKQGPKFRHVVLARLAKRLAIEWDVAGKRAVITPLGVEYVERKLL